MINRIIAVYPGRFQPMGRRHKATYDPDKIVMTILCDRGERYL